MNIWVDAQISPVIAQWLNSTYGVGAVAVRDVRLRDARDRDIFLSARDTHEATTMICGFGLRESQTTRPNHALQPTRPLRHSCNRRVQQAWSLSLGRGAGDAMQKHAVVILLCLLALPLTGMCNQLSAPASAQEQRRSAPVNDEATAIEVAVEYFKKKNIDPNGPRDALTGPRVLKDSGRKQWIVSWSFTNGMGRIAIVVNAETGKSYQADTGTD